MPWLGRLILGRLVVKLKVLDCMGLRPEKATSAYKFWDKWLGSTQVVTFLLNLHEQISSSSKFLHQANFLIEQILHRADFSIKQISPSGRFPHQADFSIKQISPSSRFVHRADFPSSRFFHWADFPIKQIPPSRADYLLSRLYAHWE